MEQILVRPISAAAMAQPPDKKHQRPACAHDVPVVGQRGAVWGVCYCAEFQYPDSDPAAVLLRAVLG